MGKRRRFRNWKVSTDRLSRLLGKTGFVLGFHERDTNHLWYVRRSNYRELFERIYVYGDTSGTRVVAAVQLSPVPVTGDIWRVTRTEELVDTIGKREILAHQVRTLDQIQEWERRLAELAPTACREFAEREGALLAVQTRLGRQWAAFFLEKIGSLPGDMVERYGILLRCTNEAEKELARHQMICFLPFNTEEEHMRSVLAHRIGVLAMVRWAQEAEAIGFRLALSAFPSSDVNVLACQQIIGSRLAGTGYSELWELP